MDSLLIKLTSEKGNLRIVSKNGGDVSVRVILLKLLMGYCWWANVPVVETIFNAIEKTIKSTVEEVFEYNDLTIDYDYRANDTLKNASIIEIFINSVKADGEEIEVTGRYVLFEGSDNRSWWERRTAFRRKINENVSKHL